MTALPEELIKKCEEIADRHENDAHLYGAWNACNGSAEDAAEAALEWSGNNTAQMVAAERERQQELVCSGCGKPPSIANGHVPHGRHGKGRIGWWVCPDEPATEDWIGGQSSRPCIGFARAEFERREAEREGR